MKYIKKDNLVNTPYSKDLRNLWLICIHDLNMNKCDQIEKEPVKTIKLNRIDLILIQ